VCAAWMSQVCDNSMEAAAAAASPTTAAPPAALVTMDKWASDESLKQEKISKWPSNEFVLVPSSIEMRAVSPCEDKMPTAFVRERLSPRTRSLESLTEVSCDVEKESEVEAAGVVLKLDKNTAAANVSKKLSPLRNAHFANRPKRAQGFSNLTVLVEDEENDTEPVRKESVDRLSLPSNGMQRSLSADLHPRKEE
ncbi:hypothetical protein PFISCL1PPCAC_26994, partial [Pristionchus fissidentatus]